MSGSIAHLAKASNHNFRLQLSLSHSSHESAHIVILCDFNFFGGKNATSAWDVHDTDSAVLLRSLGDRLGGRKHPRGNEMRRQSPFSGDSSSKCSLLALGNCNVCGLLGCHGVSSEESKGYLRPKCSNTRRQCGECGEASAQTEVPTRRVMDAQSTTNMMMGIDIYK